MASSTKLSSKSLQSPNDGKLSNCWTIACETVANFPAEKALDQLLTRWLITAQPIDNNAKYFLKNRSSDETLISCPNSNHSDQKSYSMVSDTNGPHLGYICLKDNQVTDKPIFFSLSDAVYWNSWL